MSGQDVLGAAFIMVNDIGNLDSNGIQGFTKAFKSQISPPTKIVNEFKDGAMNLAASATSYIFWTVFIIAASIIICLAYVEIIRWTVALIIIVILGLLVLLMASLLYNRVSDYISRANKELNDHIADYTGGIFEDFINAFKEGLIGYAKEKSADLSKQINPFDAEIFE